MDYKSLGKFDRLLMLLSVGVLVSSVYLMADDAWLFRLSNDELGNIKNIGYVAYSQNDVRRRHKVAFSWAPIVKSDSVFQGDSIFTGKESSAIVKTHTGDEIAISQNSLVVIDAKQDSIFLDIDFGSVQGKVDKGKKLLVGSKEGVTEFTGDNAVVDINVGEGKNLVVNVLKGEVQLSNEDGTQTINKDEAVEIDESGTILNPSEISIELIYPLTNFKMNPKSKGSVEFKWKSPYDLEEYQIQVSRDKEFTDIITDRTVRSNRASIKKLPADVQLFWRVISEVDADNIAQSNTISFRMSSDTAPSLLFPPDKIKLAYNKDHEVSSVLDINLTWSPGSPSKTWEIQVSKDYEFKTDIDTFTTKNSFYRYEKLANGIYYWRVRARDWENATWSESKEFAVSGTLPSKIRTPEPIDNVELFELEAKANIEIPKRIKIRDLEKYITDMPPFYWTSVPGAVQYELQIASYPNFNKTTHRYKMPTTSFVWRRVHPGNFYWRVRALGKVRKSSFSKPISFTVKMAPPISKASEVVHEDVPELALMDSPPPPFKLEWSQVPLASSYEVQFDHDDKFPRALSFQTQNTKKQVQVQKPGKYFWRVRAISKDNNPISAFTQALPFEFKRTYKNPEKVRELKALSPPQRATIIFVGQGEDTVVFRWTNPFPNAKYRIQVSNEPDFSRVIHSEKTNINKLILKKSLPTGWIYWRLRAESKHFTSPWTGSSRFQVIYQGDNFKVSQKSAKTLAPTMKKVTKPKAKKVVHQLPGVQKVTPALPAPVISMEPQIHFHTTKTELELSSQDLSKKPLSYFFTKVNEHPTFEWGKVPNNLFYQLEVSSTRSFKSLVFRKRVNSESFLWAESRPGRFYWRVAAVDRKNQVGRFSHAASLVVAVEPPLTLSPDQFVENLPDSRFAPPEPPAFQLEWSPTAFARGYEIHFSEDKEFKNKKIIFSKDTKEKLKVSKLGTYFWKVRSVNKASKGISKFSDTRTLDIARVYRSPASITKVTGIFPNEGRTLIFVGRGTRKFFFKWMSPHSGGNYTLEIAKTKDFAEPIITKSTQSTHLNVSEGLPDGDLYWRVKFESDTLTELSAVRRFSIKNEGLKEQSTTANGH